MKSLSTSLASQFREVQLSGRWVAATNLKETLEDIDLKMAMHKVGECNTIAALCYHIHYYVRGVNEVFDGRELTIRDKFSFDLPSFSTEEDWTAFKEATYAEAESFAKNIENLSSDQLLAPFVKPEYGDYFRNISAMISHTYYHLGQMVLLKKLLNQHP